MIHGFEEGKRYSRDTAKDLDIQVVKIIEENENDVKIIVNYIFKTSGMILQHAMNDEVMIRKSDLKNWELYG